MYPRFNLHGAPPGGSYDGRGASVAVFERRVWTGGGGN